MAGAYFKIEWDSAHAEALFQRLIDAGRNLEPLFNEIGSELEQSTRQRISTGGPAPDGTPWVDLSALTKLTKRTNKPLIERGDLLNSIRYEAGSDYVQIIAGPSEYAAVHQFGSDPYVILPKKGKALSFGPRMSLAGGKNKGKEVGSITRRKINHPGVPARPFLGLSTDDQATIIAAAQGYLRRATEP